MLIDTHCHLDFPEFDADRDLVLERARAAGVGLIINVGSSIRGSQEAVGLAARYENVFASIGVHPHDAKECDEKALSVAEGLLAAKKVVAIGEVGLDYYRNLSLPQRQAAVFRSFIELAKKRHLPLIIHSRQAQEDTLAILKEADLKKLCGIVVHCFSGDMDFLKKCLDLGFFVSFTCNVTYKKAQPLRDIVRLVPLENMFLETDAPFLAPEGKRGERNESAYMVALAQEVGRIKGIDFEKVCFQTTQNAARFFKLEINEKDYR
jgi:TatD DNase family protein